MTFNEGNNPMNQEDILRERIRILYLARATYPEQSKDIDAKIKSLWDQLGPLLMTK